MELEEILKSMLSSSSSQAPYIYPQDTREIMNSSLLGNVPKDNKTKMSKEEAILTGLMLGLSSIAPLMKNKDNTIASPRSTGGRGFPFKADSIAQYPGGARSVLTRYLLGG